MGCSGVFILRPALDRMENWPSPATAGRQLVLVTGRENPWSRKCIPDRRANPKSLAQAHPGDFQLADQGHWSPNLTERLLHTRWGKWVLFILGWAALTLLFTPEAYLYFYLRRQPIPW